LEVIFVQGLVNAQTGLHLPQRLICPTAGEGETAPVLVYAALHRSRETRLRHRITDKDVIFDAACAEAKSLGPTMLLKHRYLDAFRETCNWMILRV